MRRAKLPIGVGDDHDAANQFFRDDLGRPGEESAGESRSHRTIVARRCQRPAPERMKTLDGTLRS